MRTKAAAYREAGDTVVEVFADFGAVRQQSDQPMTLSFTAPDDTVDELRDHSVDGSPLETEVQYVDIEGTRLYVLEVNDKGADRRLLVAGGVDHQSLSNYTDTTGAARTVVRSATGTVGLDLHHADRSPFLADLG
ncbi:MAG: hypothetical protein J07HX64_00910 [halophilic archaeon J07HX64]|nr:MAG: hypothetical protein J07HX64_00910 [halophilic archaeon J07HX64]